MSAICMAATSPLLEPVICKLLSFSHIVFANS
uniref:Uncharacterized protein n=1 Tax=Arundo donax TaxID=35708 RepID=A0A0A9A036_ARUDO